MTTELVTAKDVRPFWADRPGRITVQESDATDEQRGSGLIVPTAWAGDDGMKRAVLLDFSGEAPAHLERGCVVFYRRGIKIGGVVVVDLVDVIAYEES